MTPMLAKILDWFGFGKHHTAEHSHGHGDHAHSHGHIDPTIATTDRGIWAIKWSFVIMLVTAVLQLAVVLLSGSVALLADTIHNFGDATTAIPLWVAFVLVRRKPSRTFNYGLGRVEDLAGLFIVGIILVSAVVAGYEAVNRLIHPQTITALGWVAAAGVIGFIGNEAVAVFRIRIGREINSAALIADGYHARTDGLTSLAVVVGALGVWLGFPLADPIIGLVITATIFGIVWQSARSVLTRMLDGIEPGVLEEVDHAAAHVAGVRRVIDTRAHWIGHRLFVDMTIALDDGTLLAAANAVADQLRHELADHLPALADARIVFASAEVAPDHHHAPDPVRVSNRLADGLLQIVDTPEGERMRLRVSRHADGLRASVVIERPEGRTEVLELRPVGGDHHWLQSATAPEEPHEFAASLKLAAGNDNEDIAFAMVEPAGHQH
jgi:cation diffusion facilitator family transporter